MIADTAFVSGTRKTLKIVIALAGAAVMISAATDAARGTESPVTQATVRKVIPGMDRMTLAERGAYRARMEMATTPEEKARIRAEYAKAADQHTPAP